MHYYIYEVHENPFSLFVARLAEFYNMIRFCVVGNLICDSSALAVACAGSYDEIVGGWAFAAQVEDGYICAVVFGGDLCRVESKLSIFYSLLFGQF